VISYVLLVMVFAVCHEDRFGAVLKPPVFVRRVVPNLNTELQPNDAFVLARVLASVRDDGTNIESRPIDFLENYFGYGSTE
jgi:hypothetical protein